MTKLLDLDTKLSILANNPCACDVCRQAAKLAKATLAEVAPSFDGMCDLEIDTPEFIAAEKIFRKDEAARLQAVYDHIGRSRCLLTPLPAPATVTPIPELPYSEDWNELVRQYRKHAMKPRLRKDSAEPIEHPRIPGSFVFK